MTTETGLRSRISELLSSGAIIPTELSSALDYVLSDPATSLTKSRACLEAVIKSALSRYGIRMLQEPLGRLLERDPIKKGWPNHIRTKMSYVNGIASTMGAHIDTPADAKDAIRVLEELCDILEWFASNLRDNFGNQIGENERLIIYVSRGGTCRCAMANVISRHYLNEWGKLAFVRPMSCALDDPTDPEISNDAHRMLVQRFGELQGLHQSIQIDEGYARRAELILAMDSKLLTSIRNKYPVLSKDKAFLFSEFFGGVGSVEDPYHKGIQAYEDCFETLDRLISEGRKHLLHHLKIALG